MEEKMARKISDLVSFETVVARLGTNPTQQELTFVSHLYHGLGVVAAASKSNYPVSYRARGLADKVGWNLTWRECSRAPCAVDGADLKLAVTGVASESKMVGRMTIDQCIEKANEGATLNEIGIVAGVTRERIRQIFIQSNFDWKGCLKKRRQMTAIRNKERRQAELKAAADIRVKRQADKVLADMTSLKIKHMRELWDQGIKVSKIAAIVGLSEQKCQSDIYLLRHTHGWFHYRVNKYAEKKVKFPRLIDVQGLITKLQAVVAT